MLLGYQSWLLNSIFHTVQTIAKTDLGADQEYCNLLMPVSLINKSIFTTKHLKKQYR
jgi:hypothetical protein